jgi:hypothetical protein
VKAKGEQTAQRIRDDTAARSKIASAVAKAAAAVAANSPPILDRTIARLYMEGVCQQENREAVAKLAIDHLADDPPAETTAGPSPDWLNVFSSHAEKASSETLRQHWAHILAQEIRAPGSFSLATLLMLSILDTQLAEIITRARGWIADDWIPVFGQLTVSPYYDDLITLDSIGFLRLGSAKAFHPQSDDPILTPFVNTGIWTFGAPGSAYNLPAALLTVAGKEMLQVIEPREDVDMILQIANALKPMFNRVQIGPLVRQNGIPTGLRNATDV